MFGGVSSPERHDLPGGGGRQPHHEKRWLRVGQDTRVVAGPVRDSGLLGTADPWPSGPLTPSPPSKRSTTQRHSGQRTDVVHFLALAILTPDTS